MQRNKERAETRIAVLLSGTLSRINQGGRRFDTVVGTHSLANRVRGYEGAEIVTNVARFQTCFYRVACPRSLPGLQVIRQDRAIFMYPKPLA